MRGISISVVVLLLSSLLLSAQEDTLFIQTIEAGDKAMQEEHFKEALKKYLLADEYDKDRNQYQVVSSKINTLLDKVEQLKIKAEKEAEKNKRLLDSLKLEKERTERALAIADSFSTKLQLTNFQLKKDKATAQIALEEAKRAREDAYVAAQQAQGIAGALYFYENKFALAFNNNHYYYIDKNGDPVTSLGRWDHAEPFGARGFAKVVQNGITYLIDENGEKYKVAYELKDLNPGITALDLSGKSLLRFRKSIFNNRQLKILLLSNNQLTEIPSEEFAKLKELKYLDLSRNHITMIPDQIAALKRLEVLKISNNKIKRLPIQISQLPRLRQLIIDANLIESIPESINELRALEYLDASKNKLKKLPKELGQLTALQVLNLSENVLKKIPEEMGGLQQLTTLNLKKTWLTGLPNSICSLPALTTINLEGNKLRRLPPNIDQLIALHTLDLSDNSLTTIPEQITKLKENLQSLDLKVNRFSDQEEEKIKTLLPWTFIEFNLQDSIQTLFDRGARYVQENRLEEAVEVYKRDILLNKTPNSHKELGLCYLRMGKDDEAIHNLETYHLLNQEDLDVIRILAKTYWKLGDRIAGFHFAKKATEVPSTEYKDWYYLSKFALYVKQYEQGIEAAEKTKSINRKALSVDSSLALNYVLNNQWSKGKAIIEKWRGKKFPDQPEKFCDEVFNQDLKLLQTHGIYHPDFEKIKKMLNL